MRAIVSGLALACGLGGCQSIPPLSVAESVDDSQAPGLTVRWLGASTLTVSDGDSTVMVDGFLSRPGKTRSLLAIAGLPTIFPSERRISAPEHQGLNDVDAIFVSHSHHDHVLDVARLAHRSGAIVYGSTSARRVVESDVAGIRVDVVRGGMSRCVGRFNVRVIDSPHASSFVAPDGDVGPAFSMPSRMREFRAGDSFAFSMEHPLGTILVIPSAVLSPARPPDYPAADVVLLGAGLMGRDTRRAIERYWTAAVAPGRTARVHPLHWDDFTRPLSVPLRPLPFSRMRHAIGTMAELAGRRVDLSYLPVAKPVTLPAYSTPEVRTRPPCLEIDK